jgi:2-polyprenyl-3-methyl-5-hydroxy-6-metoxy-1,4-benzoquinol methylase
MKQEEMCLNCGSPLIFQKLDDFMSVSSDIKIFKKCGEISECSFCGLTQKKADAEWFSNINSIYSGYKMFHQSDGNQEQRVYYDNKIGKARSNAIISEFKKNFYMPPDSKILDFGCGTGPTLLSLSTEYPEATLFGYDLDDTNHNMLKSIPNFKFLYNGDINELNDEFDLIIFMHSLEHLPDPKKTLEIIRKKLKPSGKILIQVPDLRINFYDLLVADHRSHFNYESLINLCSPIFGRQFCNQLYVIQKEITLVIGSPSDDHQLQQDVPRQTNDLLTKSLKALKTVKIRASRYIDSSAGNIGLFGTSVAAAWILGEFGNKILFFIDDDVNRIGKNISGVPILSMNQVPPNSKIFLPPISPNDTRLHKRLREANISFISVDPLLLWSP